MNHREISSQLNLSEVLSSDDTTYYKRVYGPREMNFPEDHGGHNGYKTEWWYFTGNLKDEDGNRFGYQLTFFKSLLNRDSDSGNSWQTDKIYMAHFAVSDRSNNKFYHFERFSRPSAGLAGVQARPFQIWLEDWSVKETKFRGDEYFPDASLNAKAEDVVLNLNLKSFKKIVLQGDSGYSQKSYSPGNASIYYSSTRIDSKGELSISGKKYTVYGISWLDREWSTSVLDKNQSGWDWFSIILEDSTEIMFYQIRNKSGETDSISSGSLIDNKGKITRLFAKDVKLSIIRYWEDPFDTKYPIDWNMDIPKLNYSISIKPIIDNQLLNTTIKYWEGAIDVDCNKNGKMIKGVGYMELTGY